MSEEQKEASVAGTGYRVGGMWSWILQTFYGLWNST